MAHIITDISRPSEADMALARSVTPATIHEAQDRSGALDPAIQPVKPGLTLCGPAVTVQCTPGDNMMLIAAIGTASLDHRGTTEFASPDDDRVFE